MAKGLTLRVSKEKGVRVVYLKEASPQPELKVIIHPNDMGDLVAVFSKSHSQVDSIVEMDRIMGDLVDGISETHDGFFLLFFAEGSSKIDVYKAIYLLKLKGIDIEIVERTDVYHCYPAIPVIKDCFWQ